MKVTIFLKSGNEGSVCSPELLVGFNQEAQISVLTQVRSNEHFGCLAALLPNQTFKLQNIMMMMIISFIWSLSNIMSH